MLIAGREKNNNPINSKGLTLVARSKDLNKWVLDREPFYYPHSYFTHECPDYFKMGDWYYLLFSEFVFDLPQALPDNLKSVSIAPEEMKDGVRIKPVDWHVYEVNDIIGGRIFETEFLMFEEILERYGREND